MQEPNIVDFTNDELGLIKLGLQQRLKEIPELQLADSELRLDKDGSELTLCPTAVWHIEGVTFAVFKTGLETYRSLFYYGPNDQFGTGKEQYEDLENCVLTLLQVQADYERDNQQNFGKDLTHG